MPYRELRELYLLLFGMSISAALIIFSMAMIAFHPGSEKSSTSERIIWINIATNLVTLWLRSPGSDGKKEAQVAVESETTNILTPDSNLTKDASR